MSKKKQTRTVKVRACQIRSAYFNVELSGKQSNDLAIMKVYMKFKKGELDMDYEYSNEHMDFEVEEL